MCLLLFSIAPPPTCDVSLSLSFLLFLPSLFSLSTIHSFLYAAVLPTSNKSFCDRGTKSMIGKGTHSFFFALRLIQLHTTHRFWIYPRRHSPSGVPVPRKGVCCAVALLVILRNFFFTMIFTSFFSPFGWMLCSFPADVFHSIFWRCTSLAPKEQPQHLIRQSALVSMYPS